MYNKLFTIGPITIYGYGLMIAIGVFLLIFWRNTERKGQRGWMRKQCSDLPSGPLCSDS